MAIDKKSLNNFLPNGFETQNQEGYKENFSDDKIKTGFDKDTLDILSGPNLNNFIDKTGKNFNTLNELLEYFNEMPIGSFPIVNTSNQLDYKSVNSFFRNVGEIVISALPLDDDNLRLLDGSLVEYNNTYARFISYMVTLKASYPSLFTTETLWQNSVNTYGVCGKFVYDETNKTLRLPRITGFIQGTGDATSLGDIVQAGLPVNTHSHTGTTSGGSAHSHTRGTMNITGTVGAIGLSDSVTTGAFYNAGLGGKLSNDGEKDYNAGFDASRSWTGKTSEESSHKHTFTTDSTTNTNSIYGNSSTVQPQAIKEYYYIVVSIDEAERQELSAVYKYKGSVQNYSDLPTDAAVGEVYNVVGEDPEGISGANFAWTGTEWDRLGGVVNLSNYYTKTETDSTFLNITSADSRQEYLQNQIATNKANIDTLNAGGIIADSIEKLRGADVLKSEYKLENDADIYEILEAEKRSTFDKSKFTEIKPDTGATLTITNDGIVSGFSSGNGIKIDDTKLSFTSIETNGVYEISIDATFGSSNASIQYILLMGANSIYISNNALYAQFNNYATTIAVAGYQNYINDPVNIKYVIDNTNKLLKLIVTRKDTGTIITSESKSITPTKISVPYVKLGENGASSFKGSIDLSQFSITVDGEEVFNGNKTGIDQIKKNDYTITGTPTISEDGWVTGFSDTDRMLATPVELSNLTKNDVLEVELAVKTPTATPSTTEVLFTIENSSRNGVTARIGKDGYLTFSGNATYGYMGDRYTYSLDKVYKLYIKVNFWDETSTSSYGTIYAEVRDENNNILWGMRGSGSASYPIKASNYNGFISIGCGNTSEYNLPMLTSSVDLNELKVYKNGELVYLPVLNIPYTQSITGNKIVDNTYRDRVEDMFNQYGYTPYYTLGTEPEKYYVTAVGEPTLSGGIASGFSSSNYLSTENVIDFNNANEWQLDCCFITPSTQVATDNSIYSGSVSYNGIRYTINSTGYLSVAFASSTSGYDIGVITGLTLNLSTKYWSRVVFKNNTYSLYYSTDGTNYNITGTPISSSNKIMSAVGFIGVNNNKNTPFSGSIDLSQFSITVDGEEVFHGYDAPVVDAYTLNTVENNTIVDYYENGINQWEQKANLTVHQQGSCTSGTAVTLLKPYKDDNYALSVPYSAKTATGFTPTQTGEYIANGKVVLG